MRRDKKGFFFSLAGSSVGRCIETIRIYLALKRTNVPVYLCDAVELVDRLLEKEVIGIVPQEVFPRYCESMFTEERVISFMNLPYEKKEVQKMLPFIKWHEIKQVELAKND